MTLKTKILTGLSAVALLAGGVVTVTTLGASEPAYAQTQSAKSVVDAAKARGTIGETPAGYLAVVGGETAAERNAMNEINIGRKALYTRKARDENLQVEVVAAIFGEKQIFCLLYTSPSPRDATLSRMPSSA